MKKKVIYTCLGLFFFGLIFFLYHVQFPVGHNFDEFHYVPSAKQFLQLQENKNWEHPPLGKELMAVGIGVFGDRPFGWRFMSTVFGALTLVGMYLWGLALFRDERSAFWVALITLVNQLLYVQARIGMLDTFMFAFIAWGLAAFTAAWNPGLDSKITKRYIAFTGLMFGLGTACKWFTIVPWVSCIAVVFVIRVLQTWKAAFSNSRETDWYHPSLWKGVRWWDWMHLFILHPIFFYFLTFIPFFFIHGTHVGFLDLFAMQKQMYDGQLRVVSSHPYMSHWTDWPLLLRPIWYAFDKEGIYQQLVRGVLLLGNPLIMISGLFAVVFCAWRWLVNREREAFLIFFFYVVLYGSWIFIPRKIAFYYYYYPAGMVLSFAIAYFFNYVERKKLVADSLARWSFLGACFGIFVYFFPILSALQIRTESFRKWMWFNFWI